MVKLSQIKDALEDVNMESSCYFNKETNEILWYWDYNKEYSTYKEEDEYNENIINMFDFFTKNDFYIMQDFIETVKEIDIRNKLYKVTKGKGAFYRFRNVLEENNIVNDWYQYRDNKYKDIAKAWCIDNNIEFEEDC